MVRERRGEHLEDGDVSEGGRSRVRRWWGAVVGEFKRNPRVQVAAGLVFLFSSVGVAGAGLVIEGVTLGRFGGEFAWSLLFMIGGLLLALAFFAWRAVLLREKGTFVVIEVARPNLNKNAITNALHHAEAQRFKDRMPIGLPAPRIVTTGGDRVLGTEATLRACEVALAMVYSRDGGVSCDDSPLALAYNGQLGAAFQLGVAWGTAFRPPTIVSLFQTPHNIEEPVAQVGPLIPGERLEAEHPSSPSTAVYFAVGGSYDASRFGGLDVVPVLKPSGSTVRACDIRGQVGEGARKIAGHCEALTQGESLDLYLGGSAAAVLMLGVRLQSYADRLRVHDYVRSEGAYARVGPWAPLGIAKEAADG